MRENIVEFPDRRAIEEEAVAWLIKLDGDGAPSAEDLASLREWIQRSPMHREQLGSLAVFWGKMNVLTDLAVPLGHAGGHAGGRANRSFVDSLRHALMVGAGLVTAVMVIGLSIGIAWKFWLEPDPLLDTNGLYATAVGQQQPTTLADGSIVLLNTNSQINVEYNDQFRNIRLLQGEAHFTVENNPTRPFRVYAGNRRIQAVGTAFSVYLKDNAVDVTVTEGSVALASVIRTDTHGLQQQETPSGTDQSPGPNAIVDSGLIETLGTIEAGESATIQSDLLDAETVSAINDIETIEAQEMARRLSWREGILTFAGDPLVVVVEEISRYTTLSIEITDPDVRGTRIGGRFPIGETDAMFDALETNFGLRVTRLSHDRVLISAAAE